MLNLNEGFLNNGGLRYFERFIVMDVSFINCDLLEFLVVIEIL